MTSSAAISNRNIFFISDAHAGSLDHEAEVRKHENLIGFFNYLATISPPPLLYIVGDLFDYWFEYRQAVPMMYQTILGHLTLLVERGVEIRYVTGNHDYWMGKFFPQYLGIPVFHGEHTLRAGSKKIQIFHGDGILNDDIGYRILKRILRNKFIIAIYRWIHPDLGIPLARVASVASRKHNKRGPEQAMNEDEQYLAYALEQFDDGFDYVILAHTHRPKAISRGQHLYVNLGDWIENFTFAIFDGLELKLHKWNKDLTQIPFQLIEETEVTKDKEIPETL